MCVWCVCVCVSSSSSSSSSSPPPPSEQLIGELEKLLAAVRQSRQPKEKKVKSKRPLNPRYDYEKKLKKKPTRLIVRNQKKQIKLIMK